MTLIEGNLGEKSLICCIFHFEFVHVHDRNKGISMEFLNSSASVSVKN